MGNEENLDLIKKYQKEIALLGGTHALLHWDRETYMPKRGSINRAEQISLIEGLRHKKLISDELFEAVQNLNLENFSVDDKIMIEKLSYDITKARKLPSEFVEELSKTTSLASFAWKEARDKNDFKIFQPHLEKIVQLKRKQAKYIGLPGHPYNSLLDDFEEGMTAEKLKPKFEKLKLEIVKLIEDIKSSEVYKNQKLELMNKKFPREHQLDLTKDVIKKMGLYEEFSRIDLAEHPFSINLGHNDIRITTNIRDAPLFAFLSTIHEAGHGLYEVNLPEEYIFTVLHDTPSLGIHESQSRFWEIMIGQGKPFWKHYFEEFDKRFGLGDMEKWYREVNHITPSKIRIESDEIHYPLHIILRFEIELGLIEGSIEVKDLPKIWNEKMKELLEIVPENDKEGVLQDVHWSEGLFGYFPTYTLGSIYAAQLYEALKKDFPNIEEDIEKGNFDRIRGWLHEKIYIHGRKFLAEDIIKEVCGEGLNQEKYIGYLRKKYSEIYDLK